MAYKGPSDSSFTLALPVATRVEHPSTSLRNYTRVTYAFKIPPGSTRTKGQVEYYFSWQFDNVENRTGGKLPVSVVDAGTRSEP